MMRPSTIVLASVLGFGALFSAAGCTSKATAKGNTVLGEQKVPEGYSTVTVQQLVEEDRWKDQKVFFSGLISKLGCAGCGGVIIADKTWRLSAEPADPSKFKIPVQTGAAIRVWGVLTVMDNGFREVKADRVELAEVRGGKKS